MLLTRFAEEEIKDRPELKGSRYIWTEKTKKILNHHRLNYLTN